MESVKGSRGSPVLVVHSMYHSHFHRPFIVLRESSWMANELSIKHLKDRGLNTIYYICEKTANKKNMKTHLLS
jgi:hypothetical protein